MERIKKEKESLFKNQQTEKAFKDWLVIGGGVNDHPLDNERFYEFVKYYNDYGESMEKDKFVKACKPFTHISKTENRGIRQKYYHRLEAIDGFLKWLSKNFTVVEK